MCAERDSLRSSGPSHTISSAQKWIIFLQLLFICSAPSNFKSLLGNGVVSRIKVLNASLVHRTPLATFQLAVLEGLRLWINTVQSPFWSYGGRIPVLINKEPEMDSRVNRLSCSRRLLQSNSLRMQATLPSTPPHPDSLLHEDLLFLT